MNYIITTWIAHLHRNARKQLFINFSVLGVSCMSFLAFPTRLNNSVHLGCLRVGCLMVVWWKEGRVVASSDFVWWHPTCVWQGRSGSLAGDRTPPSANTRGSISCQDSQDVHAFKPLQILQINLIGIDFIAIQFGILLQKYLTFI